MAISGIASPVAGTIITVSFVDLNYKDPLLYLFGLLGGFTPPGAAGKVAVSTGAESGVYGQVSSAGIANEAVSTAQLGPLSVTNAKLAADAVTDIKIANNTINAHAKVLDASITTQKLLDGAVTLAKLADGSVTAAKTLQPWTASLAFTGDGVGIFLGGDSVLTDYAGTGLTLFADSDTIRVLRAGGANEIFRASYADVRPTFKGTALALTSDLAGTAGTVPLGGVIWFETLAELTAAGANWARYTAADGRLLVGAGTSASSQTFSQATNYGTSWTPAASVGVSDGIGISDTLGITVGSLDVGGNMGGPDSTVIVQSGGASTVASLSHGHSASSLTVTGAPGRSGGVSKTGTVSATGTGTVWLPYMRAGIWARRVA